MQGDLRYYSTTVAIIPVINQDEIERTVYEFSVKSNSKSDQVIYQVQQMCPNAAIYEINSTSTEV